jgi:hypothetical protein
MILACRHTEVKPIAHAPRTGPHSSLILHPSSFIRVSASRPYRPPAFHSPLPPIGQRRVSGGAVS